jgi:hypothetical protein
MKTKLLAAVSMMLTATPALAQEETKPFTVSGSVALVTDYRFRGVSQSDEKMAIQGGITVTHESGLYAGTWASNLAGWGTFGGSNTELDLIAGYKLPVYEGITVDVGATWYMYPGGANTTDFIEPYVKLGGTVGPASATVGVAYAPKQRALGRYYFDGAAAAAGIYDAPGAKNDNLYIWGDLGAAVPNTPVSVKTHLGYSKGNGGLGPNGTSVAPTGKYWDWLIGADVAVGPVVLGVAYVGTDISNRERQYLLPAFGNSKDGTMISSGRIVGSLSASF